MFNRVSHVLAPSSTVTAAQPEDSHDAEGVHSSNSQPWKLSPAQQALMHDFADGRNFHCPPDVWMACQNLTASALAHTHHLGIPPGSRVTAADREDALKVLNATPLALMRLPEREAVCTARSLLEPIDCVGRASTDAMCQGVGLARLSLLQASAPPNDTTRALLQQLAQLSLWVHESTSQAQAAGRDHVIEALWNAGLHPELPRLRLSDEHGDGLELPPKRFLEGPLCASATTLTMRQAIPGKQQEFRDSATALKVDMLKLIDLPNGEVSEGFGIATVQSLRIRSCREDIKWHSLNLAMERMSGIREVITPPGQEPPGWMVRQWPNVTFRTLDDRAGSALARDCKRLLTERWDCAPNDADQWLRSIETHPKEAQCLLQFLKKLGELIEAVNLNRPGPPLYWSQSRTPTLESLSTLAARPALMKEVPRILSEADAKCVDGHLDALEHLAQFTRCDVDAPPEERAIDVLQAALRAHGEQSIVAADPNYKENRERGNGLSTLIDLKLGKLLQREVRISPPPYFAIAAKLPLDFVGRVTPYDDWPAPWREEATRIIQSEVNADFPGVRFLLQSDSGFGKACADAFDRDPATQARIAEIDAKFASDREAAETANPEDDLAAMGAFEERKEALYQARFVHFRPLLKQLRKSLLVESGGETKTS